MTAPAIAARASLALVMGAAACARPAPAVAPTPATVGNATTAPGPPPALVGSYRQRHTIQVVCGVDVPLCDEEVEDTMTLRDAGDGRLAAEIWLLQTNAHSCTFEGTLAPDPHAPPPRQRWRYVATDEDQEGCVVWIERIGDAVQVRSSRCTYFCGARASLNATFTEPPRDVRLAPPLPGG
ncbi:MAG: hypothetical protein H6709_01630 [Kofleriaceae bacterium]|nr:hypothetical protein [Kofleriaceae bacterium]MCB9570770.1 hypothetical protein [Kofleriaceae bacterium]